MRKATPIPKPFIRNPARAGPTSWAPLKTAVTRANPLGISSRRVTRLATTAFRDGIEREKVTPFSRERTKTCQTWIWSIRISRARARMKMKLNASVDTRMAFRLTLSANAPPTRARKRIGRPDTP